MFEKILYATDFSEPACKTLDWISGMADVREIVLLHVIDATHATRKGWIRDLDLKKAELELEDQKKHLDKSGLLGIVRLEIITGGEIADTIVNVAREEEASLIIMGSKGRGMIQSAFLGSVSRGVLHRAMSHILIMHHWIVESRKYESSKKIFTKILYPTDFSRPANEVVFLLKSLKGFEKILLLHVITRGKTNEEIERHVKEAKIQLGSLSEELQSAGKKTAVAVRLGNPAQEINRFAEETDVSLIVMARHGCDWIREMVVGSTTYAVAQQTKRPLLIFQPGLKPPITESADQ
jgi:nucleotide-binding universal stress UspA family protein